MTLITGTAIIGDQEYTCTIEVQLPGEPVTATPAPAPRPPPGGSKPARRKRRS